MVTITFPDRKTEKRRWLSYSGDTLVVYSSLATPRARGCISLSPIRTSRLVKERATYEQQISALRIVASLQYNDGEILTEWLEVYRGERAIEALL
jgi:hypothetical protein